MLDLLRPRRDTVPLKAMSRKDSILNAAQRCFAQHGYAKTSLDDVAALAGLKAGSLYHYFSGKEALFADVIHREASEMLKHLRAVAEKQRSPKKQIIKYFRERLVYFKKLVNLHDVSVQVLIEVTPVVSRTYGEFLEREIDYLSELITAGVCRGVFAKCEARRVAAVMLAVQDALKLQAYHEVSGGLKGAVDYERIRQQVEHILTLVMKGLTCDRKGE